jgi:hypothetical protein
MFLMSPPSLLDASFPFPRPITDKRTLLANDEEVVEVDASRRIEMARQVMAPEQCLHNFSVGIEVSSLLLLL